MNRFLTQRNLIIAGIGVVLVAGLIAGGNFLIQYLSQRNVSFTFSSEMTSIRISKEDPNECEDNCEMGNVVQLEKSGKVRLVDGAYYVTPVGDTIDGSSIRVVVNKDATAFTISPDYSQDYLANLLTSEAVSIHNTLQAAYPIITQNYLVSDGQLYKRGEWYATSLYSLGMDASDVYYVILHKIDGKWQLATKPSLYFSYTEHPSIPKTILSEVNAGDL